MTFLAGSRASNRAVAVMGGMGAGGVTAWLAATPSARRKGIFASGWCDMIVILQGPNLGDYGRAITVLVCNGTMVSMKVQRRCMH